MIHQNKSISERLGMVAYVAYFGISLIGLASLRFMAMCTNWLLR